MSEAKLVVLVPCRDSVRSTAYVAQTGAIIMAEKFWKEQTGSSQFGVRSIPGVQAAEARTTLWKYAEGAGADWTLWLDDDIVPPFDLLAKLWPATCMGDIVTGFYWRKGAPYDSVVARFDTNGRTEWIDPWQMKTPYEEVHGCGFGAVLVRSKVLKHVCLEHNDLPFLTKPGQTEDIYFCNAARRLGYKVIAVRDAICSHIGDYAYGEADRRRWLKDNNIVQKMSTIATQEEASTDEAPKTTPLGPTISSTGT